MKKRSLAVAAILISLFMLTGCTKNSAESEIDPVTSNVETEIENEADPDGDQAAETNNETEPETGEGEVHPSSGLIVPEPEKEAELIELSFKILNLTGVEIGMISTLDPETEEQIDLGGIKADEMQVISMEWPLDKTIFDFAVYNMNGDLVSVSEVDITGATKSVTIKLMGDNSLDNVVSEVE